MASTDSTETGSALQYSFLAPASITQKSDTKSSHRETSANVIQCSTGGNKGSGFKNYESFFKMLGPANSVPKHIVTSHYQQKVTGPCFQVTSVGISKFLPIFPSSDVNGLP